MRDGNHNPKRANRNGQARLKVPEPGTPAPAGTQDAGVWHLCFEDANGVRTYEDFPADTDWGKEIEGLLRDLSPEQIHLLGGNEAVERLRAQAASWTRRDPVAPGVDDDQHPRHDSGGISDDEALGDDQIEKSAAGEVRGVDHD